MHKIDVFDKNVDINIIVDNGITFIRLKSQMIYNSLPGVQCCPCLWIVQFWSHLRLSMTFMYKPLFLWENMNIGQTYGGQIKEIDIELKHLIIFKFIPIS